MLLDYLYYRVYKLAEFISFGFGKPHFRASMIISFPIFMNSLTIVELVGKGADKQSALMYFLIYAAVYTYVGFFFSNKKRNERIMARYKSESLKARFIGGTLLSLYFLCSVILFFSIRLG